MEQLENAMWSNEKTIRIAERFKFFKRDQLKEETITIYLDELKKLVITCEFSAYLEEALCDRFVCGIQDQIIQADLLKKPDLTLDDAYQYALTMEVAIGTDEIKPFLKKYKIEEDEVGNIEDLENCHYSLDIKEEPQPFEQEESTIQQEFVDLQGEQPNFSIEDEWDQQDLQFGDDDGKKKFVCEFCQKALSSNLRLMDHRRSHTGEKPFSCTTCNKSFSRKENLRRHTQKQLGCDGFTRETNLQEYFGDDRLEDNHFKKSPEKKKLTCQTCSQTYLKKTDLEKHLKSHTEKGKPNEEINVLDQEDTKKEVIDTLPIGSDKTAPLEKQASVPKKPKRIKSILCHICDYKTHANCRLELHLRKHTGERPFPCDMCSYKAVCKTNLNIHKRVHSTEKLLICEFCGYKTNYADKLQVHIRIHTGEKPFQCRFCDYKCADRKSLQNHERIHTGEKPYSCNFCDYRAAQRTGLVYHLKTHKKEKTSVSKKRKKAIKLKNSSIISP